MSEVSVKLTNFYRAFEEGATGGPDRWKKWLVPQTVQYMQMGTFPLNKSATGGIPGFLRMLRLWHASLLNMELRNLQLRPAHGRAKELTGAASFFIVTYTMVGEYRSLLPGMETRTRARGQRVEIPATDEVWLDLRARIIRLSNRIDTTPLLRVAG